ncbi:hypothetical protein TNIN_93781 [Trichonephila inaurata madagascariensis]|uniref:Uncharacterized protein n=1 Tax=Trichonephila inaurata madagascariensis TaxID=2747483 RepID=A0A8X7CU66_9ARAC|nr:hypothetical protein TNIN_93781 [Trichonephila inaurata madagascariensis]
MTLEDYLAEFVVALSCSCIREIFFIVEYFFIYPLIALVLVEEFWINRIAQKKLKANEIQGEAATGNQETDVKFRDTDFQENLLSQTNNEGFYNIAGEPEMVEYEPIDILQPPRLENNPFAYAYINNPFCGNDFPPFQIPT